MRSASRVWMLHFGCAALVTRCAVEADPSARPVATEAQRWLAMRRAIARTELDGLAASAGSSGFVDALGAALGELESALVEPGRLDGDLSLLAASYGEELARLGLGSVGAGSSGAALVLVVEDLHWADPSTLELLTLFLQQVPTTRLLVVFTYRPEFTPLWGAHSYLSQLTLSRLGRSTSKRW